MSTMSAQPGYTLRLPDGTEFGPTTIETLKSWAAEGRVPATALLVADGAEPISAASHPDLAPFIAAPPIVRPNIEPQPGAEPLAGIIPYRNPAALTGYYLGIVSLLPFIGAPFGVAALICGIVGLRARQREPHRRGMAHAIIAIVLGALSAVGYTALGVMLFVLS
jgi:hypothetical protein